MNSIFKKSYSAQSYINVEPAEVWRTLVNLPEYSKWNPFTPVVKTSWEIGDKVLLTVQMKKGKKPLQQTEYLTRLNPPKELAWGMNWGFLLKAERIQRVTEESGGQSKYFTEDVIWGFLCPVVRWLYGRHIQAGFNEMADGLKNYLEGK